MEEPNINFKKWIPMVAITIAMIAAVYYILSGKSSLDRNMNELEKSANVEKTATTGENSILVKCKNGENYEIFYKEGQTNFQDLVYNKCGPEGAENAP